MSTSRLTSMPLPVHATVARNASRRRVNRGVNSSVSTGAMFSMTLCFASTSQAATTTAPTAPQGRIQVATSDSGRTPIEVKTKAVSPISTPPPRAMRA